MTNKLNSNIYLEPKRTDVLVQKEEILTKVFKILDRLKHINIHSEGLDKTPAPFTLGEVAIMELNQFNYALKVAKEVIRREL
jgi:hypothetical protein